MCLKKLKIVHLMFDNDTRKKVIAKTSVTMENVPANDMNIFRDVKGQIHNLFKEYFVGYQFLTENYEKKGKKINVDNKMKEVYSKMKVICEFMKGNQPNPFTLMYDYQLDNKYFHKFKYDFNTKQLVKISEHDLNSSKNVNSNPQMNPVPVNTNPVSVNQTNMNPSNPVNTNPVNMYQIGQGAQKGQNDGFRMYSNYYNYEN